MTETVLVVDTNPTSRGIMLELLKSSRYRTIAADDFAPACQQCDGPDCRSARPAARRERRRLAAGIRVVAPGRVSTGAAGGSIGSERRACLEPARQYRGSVAGRRHSGIAESWRGLC